jgi:hypothetical protein
VKYPDTIARDELARVTGYSATSGSFAAALTKLRALDLVRGMRASPALMQAVGT